MTPIPPSTPTAPQLPATATTPSTGSTTGTTGTTGTSGNPQPGGNLDKNAFLKLMMIQLKDQDPLNPSDPTQYLSELAQFSTLEQTTNLAESAAGTAAEQHTSTALALLGHTVSYTDANGNTTTGLVQKVDFTASGPTLTVNGVSGIDPSSVNEVS